MKCNETLQHGTASHNYSTTTFPLLFLYRPDSSQHFHSPLLFSSLLNYQVQIVVQQDHTHHTLSALPITEFCYDILSIVSFIIRVPIISSIKF